jgi:hypothetical protein
MQDDNDYTFNRVGDAIGDAVREMVSWLPELLGGLAILLIGYIVAKIVAGAVRSALRKLELNKHMQGVHGGSFISRIIPNPTRLISRLIFWLVMFGAISLAVSTMGIPALVNLVNAIYGYIPNILAALIIFLAASAVSAAVLGLVSSTMGDTFTGKIVMAAAPIVIMGIAGFMILNQLKIAPEIVTITYAAMLGSAALGLALAFGLGGREVAADILRKAYVQGQEKSQLAKQDMAHGKQNAERKIRNVANG